MDMIPIRLTLINPDRTPSLQTHTTQSRDLDRSLIIRSSAKAVYCRGTDDRGLNTFWRKFRSGEDDFVDVTVWRVVGKGGELVDEVEIVVDFLGMRGFLAISLVADVREGEDACAGGVDQESGFAGTIWICTCFGSL